MKWGAAQRPVWPTWSVDYQPVDVEAVAADAMAHLARFCEVPQEGTLEQRKELLRGFVAEIGIDPDKASGTITFYELPTTSLMSMPGAGVESAWVGVPEDLFFQR